MAVLKLPRITLATVGLLSLASPGAVAQAPPVLREYEIKAAYLLNFTRYVEWPDDAFPGAGEPIVLCVLGRNPFGPLLEQTMAGRTSQARRIEVLELDGVAEAVECHGVFVSREERRLRPDLLEQLERRGLLTIGEGNEFVRDGGVLGFVPVAQTVRFAVNLDAGRRAGLRLSSRMLALAVAVYDSSSANR
jgi:YfiR/HmsC-like